MATLILRLDRAPETVIELRLGVNRFGRVAGNEFCIEHPTISSRHCEIHLTSEGVKVRDCGSTNGTFVNGERITEAELLAGQTLQLGDVELFVDNTDLKVAIPKFEVPHPAPPPVVLSDGSLVCPRHPHATATHQCTRCREIMCEPCVHKLRRRGGKVHKLCPICSHKVAPIGGDKRKKKNLLSYLFKTVKIPFSKKAEGEDV